MTEDDVNHSQVGNVFMLGAGGVIGKPSVAQMLSSTPCNAY